jgi:hypothetical protein
VLPIDVRLHRRAALIVADRESYGHRVLDPLQDFSPALRGEEIIVPFDLIDPDPQVHVVNLSFEFELVLAPLLSRLVT